jgi:hypothetical protein
MALRVVLAPLARVVEAGLTAILLRVAAVTVMLADGEVKPLNMAEIDASPIATPETTPLLFITAVLGAADTQVTSEERSAVEPSEYVPTALKDAVLPYVTVSEAGVTAILFKVTAVGEFPPPPHPESRVKPIIEKIASNSFAKLKKVFIS